MRQEVAHDSSVTGRSNDLNRAEDVASNMHRGSDSTAPALPKEGEKFTEDQMAERFGVPPFGGIRFSKTSSDICLVSRVDIPNEYHDEDSGEYVYYAGYAEKRDDQMTDWRNKALSESGKNGKRVLFFVKDGGMLAFHGCVEYAGWVHRDAPNRGKVATFKMRRINSPAMRPVGSARYATAVNIVADEDGGYVATVPALPTCISQGETKEEAQENLSEAISLYLEYLLEIGEAFPPGLSPSLDIASIDVDGNNVDTKITVPK